MQRLTIWLKLLLLLFPFTVRAQTWDLQQLYDSAVLHYPLLQQRSVLDNINNLINSNLNKAYLPQLTLNAQASYQSDVTRLNINFPVPGGANIEPLSKDQYRITADVSQLIYDGGITQQQQQLQQLATNAEQQKITVELYKLKERIAATVLSIMFIDEQLAQTKLLQEDLQIGVQRVKAQIEQGVALTSNLNILKAEILKVTQRSIELQSNRDALLAILGIFTQQQFNSNSKFTIHQTITLSDADNQRPELVLFQQQQILTAKQSAIIKAKNLPKLSAFVQGGYGLPGLNMLQNQFAWFGITGLRMQWQLNNLYTKKKELSIVAQQQQSVMIQKEIFLQNNAIQQQQYKAELSKYQSLLQTDEAIITLRKQITAAAKAQLENGVITANDYLREVNAEDQARQLQLTHKIQLLQAQINWSLSNGNF
ncbi:MAG: TolC family protein [Chitinophagaceae bacterium]